MVGKVEWEVVGEVGGWEDGWDRIVSGINASQEHKSTPRSRSSLLRNLFYICNIGDIHL